MDGNNKIEKENLREFNNKYILYREKWQCQKICRRNGI